MQKKERERNRMHRNLSKGQKPSSEIEWERFNQEPHKSLPRRHPELGRSSRYQWRSFLSFQDPPTKRPRCSSSFLSSSLWSLAQLRISLSFSLVRPGYSINYAPCALAGILQPVPVFAPLLICPLCLLQFRLLSCFPHSLALSSYFSRVGMSSFYRVTAALFDALSLT